MRNVIKALFIPTVLVLLSACSATPELEPNAQEPEVPLNRTAEDGSFVEYADPYEGFNRRMFYFNAKADEYVILPIVHGYETVTPEPVQQGVSNFFSNLNEIPTFANALFQFKGKVAGETFGRFVINTTIGLLGFFDPATHMGLLKQNEDFGQTLGFYGVEPGPYLVLPFAGPSNVRDAVGSIADSVAYQATLDELDMKTSEELMLNTIKAIDLRKSIPIKYYSSGSAFEYERIRTLYMKYRELQIER